MTQYKSWKFSLGFVLFVLFLNPLQGQQLEQYTQFAINPYLINPAIAGTEDFIHLQAGYRSQWSGFAGAPQTAYFSAHTAINNRQLSIANRRGAQISRIGVGLVLVNDQAGPLEQSSGMATFAYNFPLNDNGLRFALGINAGVKQFSYNPEGYEENLLDLDDPTLLQISNQRLLQLSSGFWLYNDHFFLGASSFQLFSAIQSGPIEPVGEFSDNPFVRHYYVMGGFKANLGNDVFLVPSVLLKTIPDAAISYDITTKLVFADQFWMGANYRKEDSFGLFAGILIKDRLELNFSYDFVMSAIRNAASGSREIHLGYRIFNQDKVVCPSKFW